jgi:hypothetical protein
MAMRRSTQMLILGLAVFVIGAGVVLVSLTGSGGKSSPHAVATTSTTIQAGTVVVPAVAPTAPASFTIPEGKQAVAVQVPFVGGLAGYARAGDTVNVYGNVEKGTLGSIPSPATRLLLSGVQVLAVTGPAPGTEAGNTTYLLALDAAQAEQVVFFARFESLWLTLAPKGQKPLQTSGRTYTNAF